MLPTLLRKVDEPTTIEEALRPLANYSYTKFENGTKVSMQVDLDDLMVEALACAKNATRQLQKNPSLGTNPHRIASIRLYTMSTMYHVVNSNLRSKERSQGTLAPLRPFLKLLLTALHNLPPEMHYKGTVYRGERGVHPQFETKFINGQDITFYGFVSTTTTATVLSNPMFCGTEGLRTIFIINGVSERAYNISTLSDYKTENEVLLEPCVTLRWNRHEWRRDGRRWWSRQQRTTPGHRPSNQGRLLLVVREQGAGCWECSFWGWSQVVQVVAIYLSGRCGIKLHSSRQWTGEFSLFAGNKQTITVKTRRIKTRIFAKYHLSSHCPLSPHFIGFGTVVSHLPMSFFGWSPSHTCASHSPCFCCLFFSLSSLLDRVILFHCIYIVFHLTKILSQKRVHFFPFVPQTHDV